MVSSPLCASLSCLPPHFPRVVAAATVKKLPTTTPPAPVVAPRPTPVTPAAVITPVAAAKKPAEIDIFGALASAFDEYAAVWAHHDRSV